MTNFYLDYENGNNAADGSTFALGGLPAVGPWKTITGGPTAARIAPGDVIRIAKSPSPVSIGNATWNNLSKIVTLAGVQTLNVDLCEVIWTAANGAAVLLDPVATDAKEGSFCTRVTAPAVPAVNTLYAYHSLGAVRDFSAYQKLSFWFKNEVAVSAGHWKICLCSDALGAVVVDTFQIPAIPSTGRWLPLTIARVGGGNLGNAIQSIALYSDTVAPPASKYVRLDNLIACMTNGLSLQSLISKNPLEYGGAESWYGIQSINETTVLLDNETNTKANAGRGYYGLTETVATYKRETVKTALASSTSTAIQEVQDSGSFGASIEFQGGYNTSSNLQDGMTFFDGLNGIGRGIAVIAKNFISVDRLGFVRCYDGMYAGSDYRFNCNIAVCNASNYAFDGASLLLSSINLQFYNNQYGLHLSNSFDIEINLVANNHLQRPMLCEYATRALRLKQLILHNNASDAQLMNSVDTIIDSLITSDNGTAPLGMGAGTVLVRHSSIAETAVWASYSSFSRCVLIFLNFNGVVGDNRIYSSGSQGYNPLFMSQTAVRHHPTGLAWKIMPGPEYVSYPVARLPILKIAVVANRLVIVSAWMKKDHATDIGCGLFMQGGQISGVPDDITVIKDDDTNWQKLFLRFTPTENGVITVEAIAWYIAGNSNAYVQLDEKSLPRPLLVEAASILKGVVDPITLYAIWRAREL